MANRREIDRILDEEYGGDWEIEVAKSPERTKRELFSASFEASQEPDVTEVPARAEVRQAIVAEDAAFKRSFRAQGKSNFRQPIFKISKPK